MFVEIDAQNQACLFCTIQSGIFTLVPSITSGTLMWTFGVLFN